MATKRDIIRTERIERSILLIRGEKVMLDADLARLYGVETKALVRAMKRNIARFPKDFMFQLTKAEFDDLRRQTGTSNLRSRSGTSSTWGGRRYRPYAFTEQGVAMLSSVLRSERAITVNIEIMRAFVRLRHILSTHTVLARRIKALERKFTRRTGEQAKHIERIYAILEALMAPPDDPKRKPIGYLSEMEQE